MRINKSTFVFIGIESIIFILISIFTFLFFTILYNINNNSKNAEENIKKITSDVNLHQEQILKLYNAIYENGDIKVNSRSNDLVFSFNNEVTYTISDKKVAVYIGTSNTKKVYFELNESKCFEKKDTSEMYNLQNYMVAFVMDIILMGFLIFLAIAGIIIFIRNKRYQSENMDCLDDSKGEEV